ncbi:MAG: hypothetical protein O3A46_02230 [Candidatus Poribacteria bacterium]|nr:hypothetical protein [Candidatus Poribacteria bacterium]
MRFLLCGLLVVVVAAAYGEAFPVTDHEQSQEFPSPVLNEDGSFFIVWQDLRSGDKDIYGQRYDAMGMPLWEPNGKPLIAISGKSQVDPVAVTDGAGGFVVVWGDNRVNGTDFWMQRFDHNGVPTWQPADGLPLCVHPNDKSDQRLLPDGDGGVYAAWEDWRNGNQDIYGQHIGADGSIFWGENGSPVVQAKNDQYDVFLALDGTGGVVATWWDFSFTEIGEMRWQVFAQRLAADGTQRWAESGVSASLTNANQGGPKIESDGKGGSYVYWSDYRNDDGTYSNIDLYIQYLSPDGTRLWGDEGKPLCGESGSQQNASAVPDGQGGIVVVWVDGRDVYDDIYAQRCQPDGSMRWGTNGMLICGADGLQRTPKIAIDGDDLWFAWYDYRRETESATHQDVYVQRLDKNGKRAFEAFGMPIMTFEGGERRALTILARNGHVAASWMETRSYNSNIFGWLWRPPQ